MSSNDDAASSGPAPKEAVTAEELARMEAALLTLPRLTREVFLAHRIDDLSYAEIAEITGLSVRQVERRMADAIYGFHCALQGRPLPRRWWWGWRRW